MSRSFFQKEHKFRDIRIAEEERYFLAAFSIALLGNQIPYQITRFLSRGMDHYNLSLPIDASVPFLPWTVSIYFFGCFIFWFFLYRRAAALPRQTADRFFLRQSSRKGDLHALFSVPPDSDDEAGTKRVRILDSVYADRLPARRSVQSFPVFALLHRLALLDGHTREPSGSCTLARLRPADGHHSLHQHADHAAACDSGCSRRHPAQRAVLAACRLQ